MTAPIQDAIEQMKSKRAQMLKERAEAVANGATKTAVELKKEKKAVTKPAVKKEKKKVKKAKAHPLKKARLTEEDLLKKYKHAVKGTLSFDKKSNKACVDIRCVDCKAKRNVHTSDLFQVTRCFECTVKARRQRQKAK